MRSRILVGLLAGTIGGFLGWLLQEHLINYNGTLGVGLSAEQTRTLVICVGGTLGLFLGAVDGVVEGRPRKLLVGLVAGAVAGVILGSIGFSAGNMLYEALGGDSGTHAAGMAEIPKQILARTFGWSLLGIGLGVGASVWTLSRRKVANGALGGFLGGFAGGAVFELVAGLTQSVQVAGAGVHDVGGPSRMVGFTSIGCLTGFFIGLVEELFKQAWVKVLVGRNEGREYILASDTTILGRDERCDVPLFGDLNVGVQHAAIRTDGRRSVLLDAGTATGTLVNGQRVPGSGQVELADGDVIQVGTHNVLFREKASAARAKGAPRDEPRSKPVDPAARVPANVCPYCGSQKDSMGGCLCTVGATGITSPAQAYGADIGFAAPVGAPRLTGLEGPYAGQVIPLSGPNLTIGRDVGCDIALAADGMVSRSHASVGFESGSFVVHDAGSSNGTYVNGVRVAAQALMPGDVIQMGNSKFRYEV